MEAPRSPATKPSGVVRRWYAMRDPDCLAEDIEWVVLDAWPAGGRYAGRAAVIEQFFPRLLGRFAEFAAEPDAIWDAADGPVVASGVYRGRLRPADPPFAVRFVHLWTVHEARIAGFEQVADTAAMQAALRPGAPR